jgi:hypothetical protein
MRDTVEAECPENYFRKSIKFMLFKALPMSSDLSCRDLVKDLCKLE